MLERVLSLHKILFKHCFRSFGCCAICNCLAHTPVKFVTHIGDCFWFWHTTNFSQEIFSELALFFRFVKKERFRFKIVDLGALSPRTTTFVVFFHVNNTPLLQIFEVHVGVAQFFFALFERTVKVALA